jgi:leader peptidase (prepilin peptidase)/N-methyltransferase
MLPVLPLPFLATLFFVGGLVLGSFGNVLIWRVPQGRGIGGRSSCPKCQHILGITDLLPVVSYVVLLGKCRYCKTSISARYPVVELFSGMLFVFAFNYVGQISSAFMLSIALWSLLLIAVVDMQTQGIPDVFNGVFIGASILFMVERGIFDPLAFVVGVGFFVLQWVVSGGKWIGSGDILLAIGISAVLGTWELVTVMLFAAYISGAAVAVILLLTRRIRRESYIAFGPFLAIGTLFSLWIGEDIISCFFWSAESCLLFLFT